MNLDSDPNLTQIKNSGKAHFYGMEFEIQANPSRKIQNGLSYSYIQRKNTTSPDLKFIDVPQHQLLIYLNWDIHKYLATYLTFRANSDRFSTSYGTKAKAFSLLDLKISSQLKPKIRLESGMKNILDVNYELVEGYPSPGRQYFINVVYGK